MELLTGERTNKHKKPDSFFYAQLYSKVIKVCVNSCQSLRKEDEEGEGEKVERDHGFSA